MKRFLAVVLWLGTPALMLAQEPAPQAPVETVASGAFQLEIEAPDEVRDVLDRHLELQRYRTLADLTDGELERLLLGVQDNAMELLGTLGYFAPRIRIVNADNAGNGQVRRILLAVDPGPPTQVDSVHIAFTGAIADGDESTKDQRQAIEAAWTLTPEMRFTQARWDAAKQLALRQLTTLRFPTGQVVSSHADIDAATSRASLKVTLDSGPAYQLGALVITGQQRYDAALITRIARLSPGTEYEQSRLIETQRRLADSGYFDSATVTLDTTGDPVAAPVRIALREAPLQKLVLGIGASTDSGARMSIEHTHHQVPGIGWRAVSKLALDRDTHGFSSDWTAQPDADNWQWAGSVLLQNQQVGSFDVNSQRWRGGRGKRSELRDHNYFLQYDRADTAARDGQLPKIAESVSANYAFTLRHFDALPFPSSGWGLGLEVGGGSTLGTLPEPYGRILARIQAFQPLYSSSDSAQVRLRGGRIALRAQWGAVLAGDGASIPSTQLFLTGGDTTVRGYNRWEIGVPLADAQTTAGRYLAVGSIEWQRPIVINQQVSDWESAVFVDAGAVANQIDQLSPKAGIGAGVRWKSPVGPLQMDLAYGLGTRSVHLHLNVGFSF